MDFLKNLNEAIFFWINQDGGHHYDWLDRFMVFLSGARNGIFPFIAVSVFAFWRDGRSAWRVIVLMVLLVIISDWSGGLIKSWFAAERPCEALEGVRLLASYCGSNSIPSNHAMNMAAAATFVGWRFRILLAPLAVLAVLVGISRIYVGVHYPGDVLLGWLLGIAIAAAYYRFSWYCIPYLYRQRFGAVEESEKQQG